MAIGSIDFGHDMVLDQMTLDQVAGNTSPHYHNCKLTVSIQQSTNQILAAQDDFRLRTPDLVVSVSKSQLKVGELFTAKISFKNPLPLTLTNCEFGLEGAGVQSQEKELKHK